MTESYQKLDYYWITKQTLMCMKILCTHAFHCSIEKSERKKTRMNNIRNGKISIKNERKKNMRKNIQMNKKNTSEQTRYTCKENFESVEIVCVESKSPFERRLNGTDFRIVRGE